MKIRFADEGDYRELALMKWTHGAEDDFDYGEHNLEGADKEDFVNRFAEFLKADKDYKIFIAEENGKVISAMFVYMIPKLPSPNGNSRYIAYLTNVYTKKEYRNRKIGTELLNYIKEYLAKEKCELIFVWPSDNSISWYKRNGFNEENEIFEYPMY